MASCPLVTPVRVGAIGLQSRPVEVGALEEEVERLRSRLPIYPTRYLYILMAVAAVEAADRTILATVMEDVKKAFHVTDTQLGVLTSAFAVVAALSVVPFGVLADRVKRVRIIGLGLIPWTLAMAWTGAATSFGVMFVARMFLGTVEATAGPTTPSLLGDYYPVERRSRIYGIFGIGSLVGTLLGFAVAGVLASLFGWRSSFFVWGAMGVVMAVVVARTLPEPARGLPDALHRVRETLGRLRADATVLGQEPGLGGKAARFRDENGREGAAAPAPASPAAGDRSTDGAGRIDGIDYRTLTNWQAAREVLHIPTLWIMYLALALAEFLMSGLAIWAPTFFRRYHGFSAAGGGSVTALLALSLVGGIVVGGRRGDRYLAEGRPRARVTLAGWAAIGVAAFLTPAFALGSLWLAVPLFLGGGFFLGLPQAPVNAMGLDILVPHLRGRAASIRSLTRVSVTALAPLLFGYLSDTYSLRAAFLLIAPTMAVSGLVTFLAAKTYERDMAAAQDEAHRQYRLEELESAEAAGPFLSRNRAVSRPDS